MTTQHTPGPWIVDYGTATATVRSEQKGFSVARCYQGDDDARLIASAPELLAALQSLIQYLPEEEIHYEDASAYRQIQAAVKRAEAAIAKATQQP